MGLVVETERETILAVLEPLVAADPVRHTIFATIAGDVRGGSNGWCAFDGPAVAARSGPALPVALTAGWPDVSALAPALDELGDVTSIGGDPATVGALEAALIRPARDRVAERLFRCDAVTPPSGVAGSARRATDADAELLTAWREPFLVEVFGRVPPGLDLAQWAAQALTGTTWLWFADGEPVAEACVRPPVAGVARIGPVYTPPGHRGRGYGSAVTAVAAADTLANGAVPVLMTDLANPTSNKIYQAIGFRAVCDRASVWFV